MNLEEGSGHQTLVETQEWRHGAAALLIGESISIVTIAFFNDKMGRERERHQFLLADEDG